MHNCTLFLGSTEWMHSGFFQTSKLSMYSFIQSLNKYVLNTNYVTVKRLDARQEIEKEIIDSFWPRDCSGNDRWLKKVKVTVTRK